MTVIYKQIATLRTDVNPPASDGKVYIAIEGDSEVRWCRVDRHGKQLGQSKGGFKSHASAVDSAIAYWRSDSAGVGPWTPEPK